MSEVSGTLSLRDDKRSALQQLIDRSHKVVAKSQRSTIAARKAQLLADLDGFDVDRLLEVKAQMSSFIDLITMSLGSEPILDDSQAYTLMQQFLALRDISEFLDVCKERIKEVAFGHITAAKAEKGEADSENINGALEVPALGMKLCREGAGYNAPSVSEGMLRTALGDRWKEVYVEQVVPAKRVWSLNMDKLFQLVEDEPDLMETIRDCLNPGAPKNAKMVPRTL